jgi:hypothetical protein
MGAGASPYVVFRRALDAGLLLQAETAARELDRLSVSDSLRLVLLLRRENDYRYEPAATKWLGLVLIDHPRIKLRTVAEMASSLDGLGGASPDVARSRLAVLLRHAGLPDLGGLVETAPLR